MENQCNGRCRITGMTRIREGEYYDDTPTDLEVTGVAAGTGIATFCLLTGFVLVCMWARSKWGPK